MTAKTVKVVARINAQPGKTSELRGVLIELVDPTRREKGCISYQIFQHANNDNEFVTVEEWESEAAIDTHMKSAHVQQAFAKAGPLLAAAPDISNYKLVK